MTKVGETRILAGAEGAIRWDANHGRIFQAKGLLLDGPLESVALATTEGEKLSGARTEEIT